MLPCGAEELTDAMGGVAGRGSLRKENGKTRRSVCPGVGGHGRLPKQKGKHGLRMASESWTWFLLPRVKEEQTASW